MSRDLTHEALDLFVPLLPKFRERSGEWRYKSYAEFTTVFDNYADQIADLYRKAAQRQEMHDRQMARVWFGIHL